MRILLCGFLLAVELFEPQLLEHRAYQLCIGVCGENGDFGRRVFRTALFLLKFLEERTGCLLANLNNAKRYILFNVNRYSLLAS